MVMKLVFGLIALINITSAVVCDSAPMTSSYTKDKDIDCTPYKVDKCFFAQFRGTDAKTYYWATCGPCSKVTANTGTLVSCYDCTTDNCNTYNNAITGSGVAVTYSTVMLTACVAFLVNYYGL